MADPNTPFLGLDGLYIVEAKDGIDLIHGTSIPLDISSIDEMQACYVIFSIHLSF